MPYVPRNSSTFENSDTGYKARVKNNRRRAFCTLRIFSSGRDAAGYIRSDVSASLKLAAKSVQGCTLLAMQRRRRYAYFQKTLHFSIFAPILMVMLNCHIGLPQHQPPLSKAQTLCNVLDIPVAVWSTYSATQQLDCALINGRFFHLSNNIIIFSHQFLQTANVLLGFFILNRKGYHVCGEYC